MQDSASQDRGPDQLCCLAAGPVRSENNI
jgi:hypothetical protein